MFQNIDREALAAKANETRMKAQAWARENLRQDFADKQYWRDLASKRNVRLPVWYKPANKSELRKFLKKIGFSVTEWKEATGDNPSDFGTLNPDWPAWAACGVYLEMLLEIENVV